MAIYHSFCSLAYILPRGPKSWIFFPLAGPNGEKYCWWQCTVKGGRESRDLGAVELAKGVEMLGAGEILLNCIDRDGTGEVISKLDLTKITTIESFANQSVVISQCK